MIACWARYWTALPAIVKSLKRMKRSRNCCRDDRRAGEAVECYLRLGTFAAMHARDDHGSLVLLGQIPQSLLGRAALIFFLLDEASVTRLGI